MRPTGRQGRTDGFFASPTLYGACRWLLGNELTRIPDIRLRELWVNPDHVYVYSVQAWETASWSREENYHSYWETGMTLTQWREQELNPREWELVLGEEDVLRWRMVGKNRILTAAAEGDSYFQRDVERVLRRRR